MASFNGEGPWSTCSGQGLDHSVRFPNHLSAGPGRRPRRNRKNGKGGFGQGFPANNQCGNPAASNYTQLHTHQSQAPQHPIRKRDGAANLDNRFPPRNNRNRKFNSNVFIPKPKHQTGPRGPRNPTVLRDADGDVVMKDGPGLFPRVDPDGDVEMLDVFTLETRHASLIRASARPAARQIPKNRNKRNGRVDADGDSDMRDAPPLRQVGSFRCQPHGETMRQFQVISNPHVSNNMWEDYVY